MAYNSTTWADDSLTAATTLTTTNEAVSVGGTFAVSGASTFSNTLTVGENDTGYDVKLFGDTSGKYMLWDTSADALKVVGDFQVTGEISVGTSAGLHQLHISDGSTSGLSTGNEAEIVITDDGIARIYFEDTGEGSGDKVMAIGYYNENLVIQSLSDDGSSYDVESILSANRDGAVTLGGTLDVASTINLGANSYMTLNQNEIDVSSGDLTVDVAGDIVLDAAGKDISLTDGSGTAEFIINLEDAPEIDVDGDFTLDVNGDITLDAGDGIFTFSDGGTVRAKLDTGTRLFQGNSEGSFNTIFGYNAGLNIASGSDKNTFFGHQVSQAAMDGACDHNTGMGYHALYVMTTGDYNTIVGSEAGEAITTGSSNVATGYAALNATDSGGHNIAIGQYALKTNVDGDENVAVGNYALYTYEAASDGEGDNTAVGHNAGYYISTGEGNTYIGHKAGYGASGAVSTGDNNTGMGKDAGLLLQGAAHSNTLIGTSAGNTTTTGVENTILGYNCEAQDATATNQIVIGNNVTGTADNAIHIGNDTSHIRCDFNADQTWDASSDRRQKKDIIASDIGLDFINDLKPCKYRYKSPSEFPQEWQAYNAEDASPMGGSDRYYYGFIAQEVKESIDKHNIQDYGAWNASEDGRQRVSREQFVVSLVKAVQELSEQVEELKSKLGE